MVQVWIDTVNNNTHRIFTWIGLLLIVGGKQCPPDPPLLQSSKEYVIKAKRYNTCTYKQLFNVML